MAFRFDDDYRARLLALPALVRRGGGSPEGAVGGLKGGRVEFHDHRPYVHGDDVRDLDWHGYLRLDQLLVKEYSKDEAPEVVIVLDRSASMGAGGSSKDRVAREVAGGLAYVALTARCPVTIMVCGEGGPVTLGAWRSHRKIDQVLSMVQGLGDSDGQTHLAELRHLRPPAASGRVTFLLSDFLVSPLPVEVMVALGRGAGSGCLLHVLTEGERHPVIPEACTLLDLESRGRLVVPDGAALLQAYAEELAEHEDGVARLAGAHGLGFGRVGDADPFERTIVSVLTGGGARP